MANDKSKSFQDVLEPLVNWLDEVKKNEVTKMIELVEQAKLYAKAAESIPEEKVEQFIDNLKHDLSEFYRQLKDDSEHSIYLGILNESWWSTLADMTDKSQVEWAELSEDFAHDGVYRTGDFIGFGELVCDNCKHVHPVTHFSEVIPCSECNHNTFKRRGLTP